MQFISRGKIISCLLLGGLSINTLAATPTAEEMWEIIQQQQQMIEELKNQLAQTEEKATTAESKADAANKNVEAAADAFESAQGVWQSESSRIETWLTFFCKVCGTENLDTIICSV